MTSVHDVTYDACRVHRDRHRLRRSLVQSDTRSPRLNLPHMSFTLQTIELFLTFAREQRQTPGRA
jgi:hypothetical protein